MNTDTLRILLGADTFQKGLTYKGRSRVQKVSFPDAGTVTALVRGTSAEPYAQTIAITRGEDGGIVAVKGRCTCRTGYNCKHVAAALIVAVELTSTVEAGPRELTPGLAGWLEEVRRADATSPEQIADFPAKLRERLVYIADVNAGRGLTIAAMRTKLLKGGALSPSAKAYAMSWYDPARAPKFVRPADHFIGRKIKELHLERNSHAPPPVLVPGEVLDFLKYLAASGRGYWQSYGGPLLSAGAERRGRLVWRTLADGKQVLEAEGAQGEPLRIAVGDPLLWFDPATGAFGPLDVAAPPHLAAALLASPPVPPESAAAVAVALGQLKLAQPPPPRAVAAEVRQGKNPTPVLRLFALAAAPMRYYWDRNVNRWFGGPQGSGAVSLGALRLSFDYDGQILPSEPVGEHRYREGDVAIVLRRDLLAERVAQAKLEVDDCQFLKHFSGYTVSSGAMSGDRVFVLPEYDAETGPAASSSALQFMTETLPLLRAAGWRIDIAPDWPYRLHEGPVAVRATTQGSGNDWFALGLGFDVNGQRHDLVPLMQSIIRMLPVAPDGTLPADFDIEATLDQQVFYPQLEDGSRVALSGALLLPIVKIFLAAQGLFAGFHSAEAGRLHEVAEALEGCGVPFDGGKALLELGHKLRALAAMPLAEPPAEMTATLRPYQKSGYGWLRALSDTGFGGVLADDMGLGKTVQALALLAHCHLARKAEQPSLLIVPTSLVGTWLREAQRFAPGLKVLVLHGGDRHGRFAGLGDHHVAITTYSLLARDQEKLSVQRWQAVILDEAHAVKNPASHAAKCIRKLSCHFRLGLTGTPMENNLEDMWSLFDWLIPGLLGNRQTFRKVFRTPIEQHGDARAQALLNGRIRPFILRRTKAEVAGELPAKTVITETIALGERQRGLYESIRLTMDERVRRTIAAKGLAASRITILAALLKLRQVCCDPALLKLEGEPLGVESAKRARLLEMLEALIAEGRRVVVFSQFVGMLRLIEADLKARGWGYEWLTGDTRDRDGAVARFQKGATPIFLISLKAGGTGLTLTAVDTVILYDPWWNPAVERQAMDRVHRIGQDRPVFIHRLVAEGAVEEAIVRLQEKKQALADALFEGGANSPFALGEDDIDLLFRPIAMEK